LRTTGRWLLPALCLALLLPPGTAVASDAFDVRDDVAEVPDTAPDVRFLGGGWGHGVGMSQYGAYAMARDGHDVGEILDFYYGGTDLVALDTLDGTDDGPVHVGLQDGVDTTEVEATDGEVSWRVCDDDGCVSFDEQPEGTWRVTVDESGLAVEVRDEDDGTWERRAELDVREVRVDPGEDAPIEVEVATGDGATTQRTMVQGTHRILDVTDRDAEDVEPELSTVQVLADLDTYLYGLAEMPSGWADHGGAAALEAQAVAGRTYAAARIGSGVEDAVCRCHLQADAGDQVYAGWDKESQVVDGVHVGGFWVDAVDATSGEVLTHEGELAEALYSSSHNGRTENVQDSWAFPGSSPLPYLQSIDDPHSERAGLGNVFRSWTATVDHEQVVEHLAEGIDPGLEVVEQVWIGDATEGGTPRELVIEGRDADGDPVTASYTGPVDAPLPIALANLRRDLGDVTVVGSGGAEANLDTLPSSQVDEIGFAPFTDDVGRVHEHATAWAAAAGITRGVSSERFEPTTRVTRGQMAAFLYRAFDIPEADEQQFDDVPGSHEHAEAVDALAEAGIAQGKDGDRYAPGSSITREQMASLLARTMGLEERDAGDRFDDLEGGVHDGNIGAIAEAGVTEGCTETLFCPDRLVPREQMAGFLHRAVRADG
jgi:SpoIID/LytB domain protein